MLRSAQQNALSSLAMVMPMCRLGCHTEKIAPVGSRKTAMRPASKTSKAGASTAAPSLAALAAASSAFATDI